MGYGNKFKHRVYPPILVHINAELITIWTSPIRPLFQIGYLSSICRSSLTFAYYK